MRAHLTAAPAADKGAMRKNGTVTRKYSDELHREIRRRDDQIHVLQRLEQHLQDELRESRTREAVQKVEIDSLAVKLNRMGEMLGQANVRETSARHIADVALNGISTVAHTVHLVSGAQIASTLFSLERDGRHQLAKSSTNGNGAAA